MLTYAKLFLPTRRSSPVTFYLFLILAISLLALQGPGLSGVKGAAAAAPVPEDRLQPDMSTGTAFDITWSSGCETPPAAAETALEYAAGLWGTWISSPVTITVSACWTTLSDDVLGTGKPTQYVQNFAGAPLVNTYYPIALASALSVQNLRSGSMDIVLQFNQNVGWSFETQRLHTPAAGSDFVTVALHELGHGLGFAGNMVQEYNVGFCGNSPSSIYCPTPYDWFAVDSDNVALFSYLPDDPYALAARLKSDANFGGLNTIVANGGAAAKLYTPNPWQIGSSLSHLDQNIFGGNVNRLMTPSYGGITHHPGPVTLAILQDMGWLRADGVPNVVTSGPSIVGVGTATPFTGTLLWDGYTGQPITYTWTATEQITTTHPGLTSTDVVTLTWDAPGEKTLTLTATDGASPTSIVRTMLTFAASVDGPTEGKTGRAYPFTADVTLGSYPVTYTWEATGQMPVTSGDNSVTFTWPMSGTQTITVTAVIEGAPTQAVHTIAIESIVSDQFIFLPLVQRQ